MQADIFPCYLVFDGEFVVYGADGVLVYENKDAADRSCRGARTDTSDTCVVATIKNIAELEFYFRSEHVPCT
jgi:hypothetical protein